MDEKGGARERGGAHRRRVLECRLQLGRRLRRGQRTARLLSRRLLRHYHRQPLLGLLYRRVGDLRRLGCGDRLREDLAGQKRLDLVCAEPARLTVAVVLHHEHREES